MTEPHHAHLAEMRRAVADVRYAAKEIDTRAWLATVPHLAPPPYPRPPQRAPAGVGPRVPGRGAGDAQG